MAHMIKNLPAMQEIQVQSLGWEDPLEKEMAIHARVLAWEISWTEDPGGLQTVESQQASAGRGSPRPEQPLGRRSALPRLGAELDSHHQGLFQ